MKKTTLALVLICLVAQFGVTTEAVAGQSQKRALQWAYIMNFIHYISWPKANTNPVVKVCIVGDNPFEVSEGDVKLNEKTGSITVTTHDNKLPEIEHLQRCDLIYFAENISLAQLSFVFSKLKHMPIVTIGEHKGFNKLGGLLQFIERGKKLGFRLNKELLAQMQLKIHPSLMRLSD